MHAKSLQSCSTLWDAMDCSLPDSSDHGICQARKLDKGRYGLFVCLIEIACEIVQSWTFVAYRGFFNYKFSTTSDWSVQDVCFILIKSWQVVCSRNSHFLLLLLICWYIAVYSVLLWYFVSLCNWFSFTFFHFLILFMWLTSFLLAEPGYRLINFIIFKKSWLHWSFLLFLSFISCLLLTLGFYISYFYNYFRREVIYLRIFLFFEEVFITMNFSNWFCCFPYSLK